MPVQRGGLVEMVVHHHPNFVAFSDTDLGAGELAVDEISAEPAAIPKCHISP